MQVTGERYQVARTAVLGGPAQPGAAPALPQAVVVDLIATRWFGCPVTIAVLSVPEVDTALMFLCGAGLTNGPLPMPREAALWGPRPGLALARRTETKTERR